MNKPALLTVAQAAEYLSVSRTVVYELVRSMAIEHYTLGPGKGAIRLAPADLDRYLESCKKVKPAVAEKRKRVLASIGADDPLKDFMPKAWVN